MPTLIREKEAKRCLVYELSGTLLTIAKDVKIQIEFNPAQVASYPTDRLREPPSEDQETSTTIKWMPATLVRTHRHGPVRDRPEGTDRWPAGGRSASQYQKPAPAVAAAACRWYES